MDCSYIGNILKNKKNYTQSSSLRSKKHPMLGEMAHTSYCFYCKNKNITKDMTKVVKKMCLDYVF